MTQALLPIHELQFETASEHHTRNVPVVSPTDSVEIVWQRLRGQLFDSASEIVVCDNVGRLMGLIRLEKLLSSAASVLVSELMDKMPAVVTPGVDQEVAAWHAIRHNQACLPVVDGQYRFQGMITPQRILEVLLWEHDEDSARLGGVLVNSMAAQSASSEPIRRTLMHRLPWLLAGLLGAMLSADLVGMFEAQLRANLILVFFVPGIVYLADAIGTQTETLVIRGLSVGIQIERVFIREVATGLLLGLLLGSLLFPLVFLHWGRADVALAVAIALFGACSVASIIAMALPWLLQRLGQDPAFAAGPLATVIQDLLSVLVYLLVCRAVV